MVIPDSVRRRTVNMKSIVLPTAAVWVLMCVATALGQQGAATQPTPANGQGMAALQRAAGAKKYLFVFFWKEQSPQTAQAWDVVQPAVAKMAAKVDLASIQATDPAEKAIVDRYDVSRAPMPLLLSIAPCGAVTKAFTRFDAAQLPDALVSPCTEQCLKALQDQKLVLLCVVDQKPQQQPTLPQAVHDFKADERYAQATEVVVLNAAHQAEAQFLGELEIDAKSVKPVTVLMAPPGSVVGKFDAAVTKDQLVAKLAAAQSGCCPGGKCGPGGCGPKR
jgi:hypothetical protein